MKNSIHLGPLFRSMTRNKTRVILLGIEIAVTVAVVLNCSAMIIDELKTMGRETGIAEDELITVTTQPWGSAFQEADYRDRIAREDLAALRALPGVKDATPISKFPLQGGGNAMLIGPLGGEQDARVRSPVYTVDPHVLNTLDLDLVAGRAFDEGDVPTEPGSQIMNILVTRDLADALFPDGNAVGQSVDTGSAEFPDIIVGVVDHMYTPYGGGPMESRITFYPGLPGSSQRMLYIVRAEPGDYDRVFAGLDETFNGVQPDRTVTVRSMVEIKAGGYVQNVFMVNVFTGIVLLLLFVTALGIFGITAYSVTQRTKQIGTRRALGAPRQAILMHFLAESTLITFFGLGLGLIGAFALNVLLVNQTGAPKLEPMLVLVGSLLLWALGLLATWVPAHRAARLSPALATRTV